LAAATGSVWAGPDFSTLPDPIKPGDILINVWGPISPSIFSFSPSEKHYEGILFGGFAGIDYALPAPFTVGLEAGFFNGELSASNNIKFMDIPLMGHFTWYQNWGVKNLDTYIGVKLGASRFSYKGRFDAGENRIIGREQSDAGWGVALSSYTGVRCFFNSVVGIFVDFDITMSFGKIQGSNVMAFFPRPSAGITVKL
jgi:hypothetical protein